MAVQPPTTIQELRQIKSLHPALYRDHVAQRLLAMTLDELDASREWMLVLGRKTAREKIASLLAIRALPTRVKSPAPGQILPEPLSPNG